MTTFAIAGPVVPYFLPFLMRHDESFAIQILENDILVVLAPLK